jgi:hypothetical protein
MGERKVILRLEGIYLSDLLIKTIGYLILWAFDGYQEVLICKDFSCSPGNEKFPNLIAYYTNTENNTMYTMGAIFDEKERSYSFHS